MTDAEYIYKHPGWVKLVKDTWVWRKGDWYWSRRRTAIYSDFKLLLIPTNSVAKYFNRDRTGENPNQSWIQIPIPREDQLMDMLISKLGYQDIRFCDYMSHVNKKGVSVRIYIEDFNVVKYIFDAPTRLLALFEAVCKVYKLEE